MKKEPIQDITGKIGPLFGPSSETEVTMYSYDRPAYNFWQGFYQGLRKRGLTDQQVFDELASKGTRWLMDAECEQVVALGEKMAANYALCVTTESELAR